MSSETLDVKSRAKLAYDVMETPWPTTDIWSGWTKRNIDEFVRGVVPADPGLVFNAGCGDHDYGLSGRGDCINLDISHQLCRRLPRAIVGDIEHIPLPSNHFDVTVCVGAVINYVDPQKAIPELIRVTKPGGLILVDFENSYSAEIMFMPPWGKPVSTIERLYVDHMDKTYLFSRRYIRDIFDRHRTTIVKQRGYHTATAMWERIFTKALIPKTAYTIDKFASSLPGIGAFSSSVLLACRKNG